MLSSRPEPERPGPGQESVWDYPRPPRLEPTARRLRVVHGGEVIAETTRALRVLETSHPPSYYFPPDDVVPEAMARAKGASFCEWKGRAHYFSVGRGGYIATEAAWGYDEPSPAFAVLRGHIAFYASRVDECYVDDERVIAQPGGFYGGWVTSDVVGPFKGGPGSRGW